MPRLDKSDLPLYQCMSVMPELKINNPSPTPTITNIIINRKTPPTSPPKTTSPTSPPIQDHHLYNTTNISN